MTDAIASGRIHGMQPLAIFTPMGVGLPATVAGLAFMLFIGSRLLPGDKGEGSTATAKRMYRSELKVEPKLNLETKTLEQAGFANPVGYRLESVTRSGVAQSLAGDLRLQGGDLLTFVAPADILPGLWTTMGLAPIYSSAMSTRRDQHRLVELVVAASAPAVGHRIAELPLPESPYEMMLVGISRNGQAPMQALGDFRLEAGDAAVVEVNDSFFYENRRESDFVLTKSLEGYRVQRVDRAVIATIITVLMIASVALGVTSMLNAALLATGAMLLTGCLTADRAWRSVGMADCGGAGRGRGPGGGRIGERSFADDRQRIGGRRWRQPHGGAGGCVRRHHRDDQHHHQRGGGRFHVPRSFDPS